MFFFFTCGTHNFTSEIKGAKDIHVQCQNCGNFTTDVMKRWEWFTFCFIPVIPFSLKPYKEVHCHVCHFWQDIRYHPYVRQELARVQGGQGYGGQGYGGQGYGGQGQGGQGQGGPAIMMGGNGGGQGPPPQGVPQYK